MLVSSARALVVALLFACVQRDGYASLAADSDRAADGGDASPGDVEGADSTCVGESAAELCQRSGAACGAAEERNRCGALRVVDCGSCSFPESCGGGGAAGQCGHAAWFPLPSSEPQPRTERLTWGSGSGGGISQSAAASTYPSLRLAADGSPVVAWSEGGNVYLLEHSAGSWWELGGSAGGEGLSPAQGPASAPKLVLAPDGRPVVAWRQSVPAKTAVYLVRWSGSAWEELAGSASGDGVSATVASAFVEDVAVDANGDPTVLWRTSNEGVLLRRWDGLAWSELAGSASGRGLADAAAVFTYSPRLALGRSGTPCVAWTARDAANVWSAHTKCHDGALWTGLGGSGAVAQAAGAFAVALAQDSQDRPLLLWQTPPGRTYLGRWNGTAWEGFGGSETGDGLTTDGVLSDCQLGVGGSDHPIVACTRLPSQFPPTPGPQLAVYRWDGAAWGARRGPTLARSPETAGFPVPPVSAIAFGAGSAAAVAWAKGTPEPSEIYVRSWDGVDWREIDAPAVGRSSISASLGRSRYPVLAHQPWGGWLVAWLDDSSGVNEVYAKSWRGAAWEELGFGSARGGGISSRLEEPTTGGPGFANERFAMATSELGYAAVAWTSVGADPWSSSIRLRHWDGTLWRDLGGSSVAVTAPWASATSPAVALDSAGNPVLAWSTLPFMGPPGIFLRAWDGAAWLELGGSGSVGLPLPLGFDLPLAVAVGAADRPIVAVGVGEVYVVVWDGAAWAGLGGSNVGAGVSATGLAWVPTLATDDAKNPVVAWEDLSAGASEIYLRRWNGGAWEELGGSASGGGISGTAGSSTSVSVAVSPQGPIYVAWQDATAGNWEIYLARWNGVAWEELDGSASGGGVSNSSSASRSPSIALGDGVLCVAWSEDWSELTTQIVARCHLE